MGRRRLSLPEAAGAIIPDHPFPPELRWPFGRLDALGQDELRESAYEIFFAACRSSTTPAAGAGTRSAAGRAAAAGAKNMAVTSRLKRALGLRARKTRPMVMASAEMMRRQMGVSEQTDGRLRKTLVRCLVGPQMSRKVESLVLPLELLRHLKPSDFSDAADHRAWQLRQLKVLEAGLVSHPSVPLDRGNNPAAAALIREAATQRGLDVRALSGAAAALSWRSVDACRWADGYPLNVHLYLSLLRAVFDSKDETAVLDEVDELLELIRKTWNVLGLNRMAHDVCFTWLLFEKYVTTGQVEPGLLGAVLTMLEQLSDNKQQDNGGVPPEAWHLRILAATLASMHSWAEDKLLDYHDAFGGDHGAAGGSSSMEKVVSLAVLAATMRGALGGDLSAAAAAAAGSVSADEQVERYIRSSVRRAFTRLHETGTAGKMDSMIVEVDEDPCETLMYVAAQTKELARVEREVYSRVLRQWHPCPTAVAAAALHGCFGALLKRHLSRMGGGGLSSESVRALQTASKLEKSLLHMTAEDGRHQMMAMGPYDVESTILDLAKGWMDERLTMGAECVRRARDSESWNPRSKAEPYAQSAVDLMKLAKVTVDELLELQVSPPPCRDELLQHLVNGIDELVQQYALLVAACAGPTKESYVPPLPPLTRCNQDSKLVQLWRKAAPPCQAGVAGNHHLNCGGNGDSKPRLLVVARPRGDVRPATSRGTQRLYVRLNTLHYLLAVLHSMERTTLGHPNNRRLQFRHARPALDAACLHISELSAYRLVFLDSAHVLHRTLYQGVVSDARIRPALRVMKQSLAFLAGVLSDRAQPLAVREVLKASVEAFLTVLLAGGSARAFSRADYGAVADDLASLKRLFCAFGVAEEAVEREAAQAEGVVALMALSTDKLVDELLSRYTTATPTTPADELPLALPPTTRRWSRSDPNTILRVLCYRDDEAASRFLKKAFHLPKRR
ncbi:unnamed protein product [Urochloa decumbens]|uniref:Uncharacterized protein n=1 Tax=Urochloa decumbens TaxID=240449 RepID=A0ABC9A5T0_9POAL